MPRSSRLYRDERAVWGSKRVVFDAQLGSRNKIDPDKRVLRQDSEFLIYDRQLGHYHLDITQTRPAQTAVKSPFSPPRHDRPGCGSSPSQPSDPTLRKK